MKILYNIWSFIWPWSASRIANRNKKACERGKHDLERKIIHTRCWAVDNIELHCKHCEYKREDGYKINYD